MLNFADSASTAFRRPPLHSARDSRSDWALTRIGERKGDELHWVAESVMPYATVYRRNLPPRPHAHRRLPSESNRRAATLERSLTAAPASHIDPVREEPNFSRVNVIRNGAHRTLTLQLLGRYRVRSTCARSPHRISTIFSSPWRTAVQSPCGLSRIYRRAPLLISPWTTLHAQSRSVTGEVDGHDAGPKIGDFRKR